MTGDEILWWLQDLWYDILNLNDANIPSLLARLVLLFFVFLIVKGMLQTLWRVFYVETFGGILEPIFKVVFFPFRLPAILWRWIKTKQEEQQMQRERAKYEAQRATEEQRQRDAAYELEQRREQERIAELVRLQQQTRIR